MAAHSELNAWLIPPVAHDEWLRLTSLLNELDDEDVPCRGTDADAWWPENAKALDGPSTAFAVGACRRCPVQPACLEYALASDERYGIWGAALPDERRSMRASAAKTNPTMRIMAAS